jgi:hypothetical protein
MPEQRSTGFFLPRIERTNPRECRSCDVISFDLSDSDGAHMSCGAQHRDRGSNKYIQVDGGRSVWAATA